MCITYEYIHLQTVAYYAVIILVLVPGMLSPANTHTSYTQKLERMVAGVGIVQVSKGRDISASMSHERVIK